MARAWGGAAPALFLAVGPGAFPWRVAAVGAGLLFVRKQLAGRVSARARLVLELSLGLVLSWFGVSSPSALAALSLVVFHDLAALALEPPGAWREAGRRLLPTGLFAVTALVGPALELGQLRAQGGLSQVVAAWLLVGLGGALGAVRVGCYAALSVLLEREGELPPGGARRLSLSLVLACAAATALRGWDVLSVVRLPTSSFLLMWNENPYFTNLSRLALGGPAYPPPEGFDAYVYGPMLERVGLFALRPLDLWRSVRAHRGLMVAFQVGAALVASLPLLRARSAGVARVDLALWRLLGVGVILLAVFTNFLSSTVHPDHALALCTAAVIALLQPARRPWSRGLQVVGLVAVPCLAMGFKFTGIGLAAGASLALALERRWVLAVLVPAASALVALGYALAVPHAWHYNIALPASHPWVLDKVLGLPLLPAVVAGAACAAGAALGARRSVDPERRSRVWQLLAVSAAMFAVAIPAYARYGGNENTFTVALLASVVALWVSAGPVQGATLGRASLTLGALASASVLSAVPPPFWQAEGQVYAEGAFRALVAGFRQERAQGRRVLPLFLSAAWVESGARAPLRDQPDLALQYHLAGSPRSGEYLSGLAHRGYDTVVLNTAMMGLGVEGRAGDFAQRLVTALLREYAPGGSLRGVDPSRPFQYLVLRRRRSPAPRP